MASNGNNKQEMSMGHIWNKDLFDDPRDYTIAKLRFIITKFKAYDQQRKDYYKSVIEENKRMRDELNSGKDALTDDPQRKKNELIKQLKAQVSALNIKLANYGLTMDGVDKKDVERMREENRLHTWKLQIAQLNDEVHRLKETNNRLIYELNKERIKNRENADV